jgi:hypothetical protein
MATITCDGVRFDIDDAQAAVDEWGFNCGPGALCAVLNKTPSELRPHLGDFEQKGYTNPSLMASILRNLNVRFTRHFECRDDASPDNAKDFDFYPRFGLIRIQWAGPWTKGGGTVPQRLRPCRGLSGVRCERNVRGRLALLGRMGQRTYAVVAKGMLSQG